MSTTSSIVCPHCRKEKGANPQMCSWCREFNYEVELTALRDRVRDLTANLGKAPEPAPAPAPDKPEPKVEDFPDYDAFMKASIQYHAEKIATDIVAKTLNERQMTDEDRRAAKEAEDMFHAHEARLKETRAKYDDFDEVVKQGEMPISKVMLDGIISSEIGPEVSYYLAKHPEERERLRNIQNVNMAIRAFGKLEAKVEAEVAKASSAASAAPAPTAPASAPTAAPAPVVPAAGAAPSAPAAVTRAPDPISPVTGATVTSTVPMDQMPYREYAKIMNAREAERRKAGVR